MSFIKPVEPIKGFLVEYDTGKVIKFQYNPEQIEDSRSPQYANIVVPGISHPKHHFINGGVRQISFQLYLRYGGNAGSPWGKGKYYVKYVTNWLRALTYPKYDASKQINKAPSKVLFSFGRLYRNLPCVIVGCKIRYTNWFDPEELAPLEAYVDLVLEEDIETSISRNTVLTGVR